MPDDVNVFRKFMSGSDEGLVVCTRGPARPAAGSAILGATLGAADVGRLAKKTLSIPKSANGVRLPCCVNSVVKGTSLVPKWPASG